MQVVPLVYTARRAQALREGQVQIQIGEENPASGLVMRSETIFKSLALFKRMTLC